MCVFVLCVLCFVNTCIPHWSVTINLEPDLGQATYKISVQLLNWTGGNIVQMKAVVYIHCIQTVNIIKATQTVSLFLPKLAS